MNYMKNKVLYWIAVHAIVLSTIFLIVLLYWSLYPYKTVEIKESTFPVLNKNKTVIVGENLAYRSTSCRYFIGEIVVHRTLVNHTLIDFPDTRFYQDKKACVSFVNRTLEIPSYAPSGKYHLEITNFIKVNPIRTISVKVSTEEFTVINENDESR